MRTGLALIMFHACCSLLPQVTNLAMASVTQACTAPSYFGVCNPYVPGVFIGKVKNGAIPVFSTWHNGPAEKAGVCPGDSIIAVNDVSAAVGWDRILHELVSTTPKPVLLKVRRGKDVFDVRVFRVRETTLATLSGVRFGRDLVLVPVYTTDNDVQSVENFQQHLFQRVGFKLLGHMEVPAGTPAKQVQRLQSVLKSDRAVKAVVVKPNTYSAGFNLVVLKNPFQVLVARVLPGSPAHGAGLWVGDELATINGQEVSGIPLSRIEEIVSHPGTIILGVRRDGAVRSITVNARPATSFVGDQPNSPIPSPTPPKSETYITGISVLWDSKTHQTVIDSVDFPSPAFAAQVHPGSEIVAIDRKGVSGMSRDELAKRLSPTDAKPISLTIEREGKQQTIHLVPVQYKNALASIGQKLTKLGPAPMNCPD